LSGRGVGSRIISDLNQPWGESRTCTACGTCVHSCPTGALFDKGVTVAEMRKDRGKLEYIVTAREKKQWIV
jgi:bidirectional [NiFe] hydrogenase diaphorase subunit